MQRWLFSTPGQTFILCPAVVIAFEVAWHRAMPEFVPWGCLLLAWGYLQYRFVGHYRHPRAGGGWGFDHAPDRVVDTGPYRLTRNPMYLGHLIFMTGLVITFRSWFALLLLVVRAVWFHGRVLKDEQRLAEKFGADYAAYRRRVKRWIPGMLWLANHCSVEGDQRCQWGGINGRCEPPRCESGNRRVG
jgi:protein-S-isoprenylcysteine O-methyltransferase Ste14